MFYRLFFVLALHYIVNATPIEKCAPYLNSIISNKKLGSGAQGAVYEGHNPKYGQVAIKFGNELHNMRNEIEIIEKLNHYMKRSLSFNGFVRLYEVIPCGPVELVESKPKVLEKSSEQKETLYMVMEKLDGLVKDKLPNVEDISTFGSYLAQCFYILEKSFTALGFIHGDLNSGNIMLKKEAPTEDSYFTIQDQNNRHLYLPKEATQFNHVTLIDYGLSYIRAYQKVNLHMKDASTILIVFLGETPAEFFQNLKSNQDKEYKLLNDLYFQLFKHFGERTWDNFQIKREKFDLIWLKEFLNDFDNWYELMTSWKYQPIEDYRFLNHEFFHHLFGHQLKKDLKSN